MKKYSKAFIVSAIVALIGTILFTFATMKGVSYSPAISTEEMETLTYSEVTKLMLERKQETSAFEYISSSIRSGWFWTNTLKFWFLMLVVSFTSFIVAEKWCRND